MRYISSLAFVLFMVVVSNAQQVSYAPLPIPAPTTPAVVKFDTFGAKSSKEEKTKLKKFAAEFKLKKDEYMMKHSQLFILSYGGRRTYSNEALKRANRAKRYLVEKQGLEPERISIIDSGYRENWEIELYFVPPGAVPPNPDPTLDADDVRSYEAKRKKRKQRVKKPPTSNKYLDARRITYFPKNAVCFAPASTQSLTVSILNYQLSTISCSSVA